MGSPWPYFAKVLIDSMNDHCSKNGLAKTMFQVDGIPISLNHQYEKGKGSEFCSPSAPGAFLDKRGRWRRKSDEERTRLRPEVVKWRHIVAEAMGDKARLWKPTGVTGAILLFESPYWLTGRREVREMDADNKAKPAFDAVQQATGVPDELHWKFYVEKVLSKRQRTTIFLFDLGDVVEYWY